MKDLIPLESDWLLLAVSLVRWRCVDPTRPRKWLLNVPFQVVYYGSIQKANIGYEVSEPADPIEEDRHNEVVRRFHLARQSMMTEAQDVVESGRFSGLEYINLLPPGVPPPPRVKSKRQIRAERTFEKQVTVIPPHPTDPMGRWAIKHKPTGVVVYMKSFQGRFEDLTEESRHVLVSECLERLNEAIAARRGQAREERPC